MLLTTTSPWILREFELARGSFHATLTYQYILGMRDATLRPTEATRNTEAM